MIWTLLNDQAPYLISEAEPRNILKKAHFHQSEAVNSWKKGRVPSAGWGWASALTGRILIIDKWRILCCFLRVFFYIWVCWCQGNKLTLTSSLSSTVSVAGLCAIGQLFLQETLLKCRIFFCPVWQALFMAVTEVTTNIVFWKGKHMNRCVFIHL